MGQFTCYCLFYNRFQAENPHPFHFKTLTIRHWNGNSKGSSGPINSLVGEYEVDSAIDTAESDGQVIGCVQEFNQYQS